MSSKTPFIVVLIVLMSCSGRAIPTPRAEPSTPTPPTTATGSWNELPRAPVAIYRPEGAFWIKGRLVVVAGSSVAEWDPDTNEWRVIATIPQSEECEGCGYSEAVVWTGKKMLLWGGGFSYRAPDGSVHEGVAVTLEGDIRPLPDAPIRRRGWHSAVWTGREMVVFGGGCNRHECRDAAAFNPRTREWRRIASPPVPGYAHSIVWTGAEMIVWGGTDRYEDEGHLGFPGGFLNSGAAYDPSRDSWRLLADAPLDPRGWHTAVWTGREMLVWGGVEEGRSDCYDCGYPSDAGAYDPKTDTWREIDPGPLSGRVEHTAVWAGRSMIVYGGSAPGGGSPGGKDDGAVYDPGSDSWSLLPEAPIRGRYRHAALWNGKAMIVWAGQRPNGGPFFDGALFHPGE